MVEQRCSWSNFPYLLVISLLISVLSGCSSEYTAVGPKLESGISISGGTMGLVAGKPGGPGNSDGTGYSARFNSPRGIAADGYTLYVSDKDNHTIRKINISTGAVTTIAGYPGKAGVDDGTGENARFYSPEDLATDGNHLYVTDTLNNVIRKIDISTGHVVTLCGKRGQYGSNDGAVGSALFRAPAAITIMNDFLYVADTDNGTIRRIDKTTGDTITIAGNASVRGKDDGTGSSASFYYPFGIAADGEFLYVADTYNHSIRRVDPETGEVITLAGKSGEGGYANGSLGEARFYYPYGVVIKDRELFVADLGNDVVRVIDLSMETVNTIAGTVRVTGSADGPMGIGMLNSPADAVVVGDYLYVVDMGNNAIRAANLSTGELSTLAGYPSHTGNNDDSGENSRFSTPGGVATDGETLYVADTYNHTIRKIDAAGNVTTLAGTPGVSGSTDSSESPALFSSPTDVIVGEGSEYIYIVDSDNHVVRSMNIASGEVRTFAGYPGIAGSSDGVERNARFRSPRRGVRIGDNMYVVDSGNHVIRKVNIPTKEVTTLAGVSGTAGWKDTGEGSGGTSWFNTPGDIATEGTYLFVADTGNHVIRKVDPSSGMVETITGFPGQSGFVDSIDGFPLFNSPEGVSWSDGVLFIADTGNHVIRKLDLNTMEVSLLAGDVQCVNDIEIINGETTVTKRCSGEPSGTSIYGDSTDGTGETTSFINPTGISTDGVYLYVMDTGANRIRRVDMSTGETKTFSYSGNKGISLNSATGGDMAGNTLYIADRDNHIVRKLDITDLAAAPLITIAGNVGQAGYLYSAGYSAKFYRPVGIVADGAGNLYVADTGNHTIRKIVISTSEVTTVTGVTGTAGFMNSDFGYPLFNLPRGICIIGNHLYVADSGNHLIRRVSLVSAYVGLVAGLSDYVTNTGSAGTTDSTGAAAGFYDPRGIATDGTYLYVTDSGNHTIRRILAATGQVKTIAGMPGESGYEDGIGFSARFNYPRGITIDGDYLYVADTGNNVFRRINRHTYEVLTFSGKKGESSFITGPRTDARYNNIVSVTTDSYTPYLYFTDSVENVVGKIKKE